MVLALSMALGALASARYHFFMQNYSTFVIQQVLPAAGKMHWADKALRRSIPQSQIPKAHLDKWPWSSPLFRNQHQQYGDALSPISGDYIGIWHYTKMIITGQNPYMIYFYFTYNYAIPNTPSIQDSEAPAQIVGPLSYPPFSALVLVPFYSNNYFNSLVKYYLFFGLFLIISTIVLVKRAETPRWPLALLLGTTLATSYPIGFLLDRGNIEGLLFIFVTLGILSYRFNRFYLSALLFAMAASCKIYPGIFMLLFLLDRRWKEFLFGSTSVLLLTFVSLVVINNPISDTFHQFLNNLSGFNEFLLFDGKSIQFNHTLCSLISGTLFADFYDPKVQSALRMFCTVYPYAIGGLTLAILWRIRRFPFQARVSILTVMMVFFPFVSFDYTLIYLYIPFAWLLLDLSRMRKASLLDLLPVCLIGLISLPKQYLVGLFALGPGISFAVNGLALGALLVLFLVAPSAQEPSPAMSL